MDAAGSRDARSELTAKLAAVTREHERVLQGFTKGFIAEMDAERMLPGLRRKRDKLEAELEACERPVETIVLYPTAVASYLGAIDQLRVAIAAH